MRKKTRTSDNLSRLATEQTNRLSADLDRRSSLEIVRIMNAEDARVSVAVERVLPQIARAIDWIADAIRKGGRLIYVGTGTSGRIAALDAAECPPTFNADATTVQFIMAGGPQALGTALEGDEDSAKLGEREMARRKPRKNDVVVGIAASGRTPFTIAALRYARRKGAKTVAVVCNPNSELEKESHIAIVVKTGAEAISGSTRLKAGTAQKMVLNMLSSGAFTRLGYVYGNLMVNLRPSNLKLAARAVRILQQATGVPPPTARKLLNSATGNLPAAIVMWEAKVPLREAEKALAREGGNVRRAIETARSL